MCSLLGPTVMSANQVAERVPLSVDELGGPAGGRLFEVDGVIGLWNLLGRGLLELVVVIMSWWRVLLVDRVERS